MRLEQVTDVGFLQKAALLLESENKKLIQKNRELQGEILKLKGLSPEQLLLEIEKLEEQLRLRNRMLFGDSSEKRARTKDTEEKEPQKGHGPTEQPELRILEVVHELDAADKKCTQCGGALGEFVGQFEESEEIDVLEREFVLKKHKRKKYRCACGACVETALAPQKLIEGGRYSVDFGVLVAVAKYADHLPLERQVKMMKRRGLSVTSQTLWDQLHALTEWLLPAYEKVKKEVLSNPLIGVDETHWKLMKKGGTKRHQVWAAATSHAVVYQIEDSRSANAAAHLLGTYCGTVMCDGYAAYQTLSKKKNSEKESPLVLAHCWAHVRRKFVEIEESFPKEAGEMIEQIGALYKIEKQCPTGPPGNEMRKKLRQEQSKPIVENIKCWLEETEALAQSGLRKAIDYARGVWKGLVRFLDDPAIPLDNNATERALRGLVVGRKNHYGSKSEKGTKVAAVLYTLVESAKLQGLDPHLYLRETTFAALRQEQIKTPAEMVAHSPKIA